MERLKSKKQSIDILKEDIQMQEQSTQSGSLNFLTIANAIFLPMGAMIGFFGMNFKSMGAPSLSTGIFNIKHAQFHIFWVSIVIIGVIVWFFYFYLKLL